MIKKAIVIGAGIGGLAAAIRLAAKGYQVQLFEANDRAGGKIKELLSNGFRFDMGPSVITMPHLIDELFQIHGKDREKYIPYSKLEKPFKYFFPDGSSILSYDDLDKFGDVIETNTTDSKRTLFKYLKRIKSIYDITKPVFIESSIHRLKDYFNWRFLKGILLFHKIQAFRSMNNANHAAFNDSRLVRIMNNYATYVGSNPFVAPATLNVIQHLEITLGVYLPDRGIYSIIEGLVRLAKEVGIEIKHNTLVEQIIVKDGKASGIIAEGRQIESDIVVSNMDIYYTYHKLLPNSKKPLRILDQDKSSSAIGFYWGIDKEFPELNIHNMLFSNDQKAEFDSIFNKNELYTDPSIYLCITSKKIKEDAPKGKENWFVLLTVPNTSHNNEENIVEKARELAIQKINKMLNTKIQNHIEFEEHLSPFRIEKNYHSAFGAVYGNSSNSKWAAFMRHANFSNKINDLYFVGGSVHPGAGIPMCLNSAKIMEQVMDD